MTPNRATVKQIAGEAGVPVRDALALLRDEGFDVKHPKSKLEGGELRRAREALGLRARRRPERDPARRLSRDELIVQLLRPLRTKGKVGRTHTTPIENVWGRGIPDHQKSEAQGLVEELLRDGHLREKISQQRRHVWMTNDGLAILGDAEDRTGS